jgi:hypothetical protein
MVLRSSQLQWNQCLLSSLRNGAGQFICVGWRESSLQDRDERRTGISLLIEPDNVCDYPAHVRYIMQRRGNDLSAKSEFYRWFSSSGFQLGERSVDLTISPTPQRSPESRSPVNLRRSMGSGQRSFRQEKELGSGSADELPYSLAL